MTTGELLYWIMQAGVALCAITGVLDAGRKGMDLVGASAVGLATAGGRGARSETFLSADQSSGSPIRPIC